MRTLQTIAGVLLAVGVLGVAGLLPAQDKKDDKAGDDKDFAMKASAAGLAEVNLSNLAARLSANPALKQFATRMVADHTRANGQLVQLANSRSMPLAQTMDEEHKKILEKLSKLSGADMDRAYAGAMVKDHEEAVKLFEREARDGQDQALKAWAAQTLPVLKKHLAMAQNLARSVKEAGR
jgi:putative membrane protein